MNTNVEQTKIDVIALLKKHNVYDDGYAEQEFILMKEFGFDFREAHKWLCKIF